ncbi:MAG TPA: S-methyl-5'-thioinosine phosphorylase [Rhodanobacteraceae bacterium]|nr:S-methyl-5'-thioinosine phosphorylase [Rhodanobacteraceae bacterium]
MDAIALAVIGGSGLYALDALEQVEQREVETPWGAPSAAIRIGRLGSGRLAFLARHGEGHALAPHRINYRANLWALRQLGARRVLGINSVGGIRADLGPRKLALPDQLIDYTHGRAASFDGAGEGMVMHAEFAEPYSEALRQQIIRAAAASATDIVAGGCYGATQGPRLETRAEIERLRRDGCDMVGMTGMPEAALARELGLDYACLAPVGNWAAGCGDDQPITLAEVVANVAAASQMLPPLLLAMMD